MTVAELIGLLQTMPADALVFAECEDNYYDGLISEGDVSGGYLKHMFFHIG